ncbi:hypothetical protein, partial [Haloferula sp.]|uniref:hypothetical protein n=1 Tax=Haloferula sp. TaxID=2497595 RepID=UPI003C70BD14
MNASAENLDYPTAKKLLGLIQVPGEKSKWEDIAGAGAVLSELNFDSSGDGITIEDLKKLKLPSFCSSLFVSGQKVVKFPEAMPDPLFLTGSDLSLGPRGGQISVLVEFFSKQLKLPFSICFIHQNEMPFIIGPKNTPPETWVVALNWGNGVNGFEAERCGVPAAPWGNWVDDEEAAQKLGLGYIEQFGFPDPQDSRVLKYIEQPGRVEFHLPSGKGWAFERYSEFFSKTFLGKDTDQIYVTATFSYGGAASLSKGPENLMPYLGDVVAQIATAGAYETYEVDCSALVAESWRTRESRRKKMARAKSAKGKQPVLQELGRLTQENGAVSEVKLLVAEEGYTITLDFVDE